jgi:lipoate-protein ligase A
LIVPNGQERHHAIYALFHRILAQSLRHTGYEVDLHERAQNDNYLKEQKKSFACFNRPAFTEVTFRGKKLVGSAQKVYRNSLLQHGSIMIAGEQSRVLEYLVLSEPERKILKKKVRETAISLSAISDKTVDAYDLSSCLTEEFARHGVQSIYYRQLTRAEHEGANKLSAQFDRTFI